MKVCRKAALGVVLAVFGIGERSAQAQVIIPFKFPDFWIQNQIKPNGIGHGGLCRWAWYWAPDTVQSYIDPNSNINQCSGGIAMAYAKAQAYGMTPAGKAWAKDECLPSSISCAASQADAGQVKLYLTYAPSYCYPVIRCDWKPKFTLRVKLQNSVGSAQAGAAMVGACDHPPVTVEIGKLLEQATQVSGQTSVTIGPLAVGVTSFAGEGANQETPFAVKFAEESTDSATATYGSGVSVNAMGDSSFFSLVDSSADVFDAKPGLDLFGSCRQIAPNPFEKESKQEKQSGIENFFVLPTGGFVALPDGCTGDLAVVYGWY